MGMDKESPLMTIWDGDKLVGLHIHCPIAVSHQPDRLEEELVRIFNEYHALKKMIIDSRMRKLCWCDSCGEKRNAKQTREKLCKELEQELKGGN